MAQARWNLARAVALAAAVVLAPALAHAQGKPVKIRVQSVIPTSADEVTMLKDFAADVAALPEPVGVSMNCWRFDRRIFAACRAIGPSVRGELEITDAVQHGIDVLGMRFRAVLFHAAVLDLSSRHDVAGVAARLQGMEVRL